MASFHLSSEQQAAVPPILVRPEEAAQMLGISRTAIFGLLGRGEVASVKIGGRRRVPVAALHGYVERLAARPAATSGGCADRAAK